ncbi:MAG: TraB/GumN family protein [Pseudomonadota bacterium]
MWAALICANVRRCLAVLLVLVGWPATAGEGISLWRVQSPTAEVYLLGSLHALRETDYPLPIAIEQALASATEVTFEVNLNDVSQGDLVDVMQRYAYLTDGQTLDSLLTADTLRALRQYLADHAIPFERINDLRPWYLSVTLGLGEMLRLGFRPELGVDRFLMKRAAGLGKKVVGLESLEEQVQVIASDPPALADASLRATLEDLPRLPRQIIGLFSAWSTGDAEGLYRLSIATMASRPELAPQMERVIFSRNRTMTAAIEGLLARQGTFMVVVGAMHLGGAQGVLRALERDYRITQATAEGDYIALDSP